MPSLLPIYDCIASLKDVLRHHNEAVLEAPPGAGKTTVVPLELLSEPWLSGQKILLLEPRRVAAKLTAQRLATNLGENVGDTVGYRIRLEKKISTNTRIEVITEGILSRLLQHDPSLEGIGLIIFDEFHERSLEADLGLALTLYGRELFRDTHPLRLLVMSATLDGLPIAKLLGSASPSKPPALASVISSQGRQFPIQYRYTKSRPDIGFALEKAIVETIKNAIDDHSGNILVFLPGQREIRGISKNLHDYIQQNTHLMLTPLYGNLSLSEQQRAIAPPPVGKRKIVLATSIAETSVTIEGVSIVIDSGLSRLPQYDSRTGLTRLSTQRVSQASSVQRAGRAGRLEAGLCYRLWPEHQQPLLTPHTPPEIEQADLTNLTLQLHQWGVEPKELQWLTPPPMAAIQHATNLLIRLGAITEDGANLTKHGMAMAALPIHPRFSHMMLKSETQDQQKIACLLASMLPERDLLQGNGCDINSRLEKLIGFIEKTATPSYQEKHAVNTIQRQARQYLSQLRSPEDNRRHKETSLVPSSNELRDVVGLLVAFAYPDRIAKQRPNQTSHYVLANGREAVLPAHDPLRSHQWLAVANSGGHQGKSNERIYLAAPLNPTTFTLQLASQISIKPHVQWSKDGKLIAEEQHCIGKILIKSIPISSLSQEEKVNSLVNLLQQQGLGALPWTDSIRQWQARILLLREHQTSDNDTNWPDVSDENLLSTIQLWLAPYLNDITHTKHLKNLDLHSILLNLLPWPLPSKLEELAPLRIKVPSGASHRIDYSQTPPVLAVKLQEMFGCQSTPSINANKIPLMIHLLSPAKRPLQITQDLGNFWNNGYQSIKKEMKGRYPKHPWPDDPTTALATAKTKRHLS